MIKVTEKSHYWMLAVVSVLMMIPHSMAFWGNGNYPTDACVYLRCAEWMQDGLTMYRDMFDHKGPLVYMIYGPVSYLGTMGVWLLDVVILYISLLLIYRIARLFVNNRNSLVIAGLMACFIQLPFWDEGGPEWLATPGCIYGCYLFAKHLKDRGQCSFVEMALFSAAVGICLFTKPNTVAGLVPLALYFALRLFRHFDWKVFGRYVVAVIVGLAIVLLPIGLWLYQNGNLQDFIDAYWTFNTSAYAPMTRAKMIQGKIIVTSICLAGLFPYAIYAYVEKKRSWQFWFISLLFFFTVLMNAYLKNGYPHYIFPCVAVFALVMSMVWSFVRSRKWLYRITLGLFMLIGIGTFGARTFMRMMPFDISKDIRAAQFINANTTENDYVMVCDIDDRERWSSTGPTFSFTYRLWLRLKAKPASPYFYLPPSITDEMRAKSWRLQQERMPKFVVCTNDQEQAYIDLGYKRTIDLQNDFYILQRP